MLAAPITSQPQKSRRLTLQLADCMSHVVDAQRLRHRVFIEEMGAHLPSSKAGIESDIFDPFCEHLLVRDPECHAVVGTCRILNSAQAKKLGGFHSENEFDLVRLWHLRENMIEVGRVCVHPAYRNGPAISLLWAGLADYMSRHNYQYAIGCASMSMMDGGHVAASVFNQIPRENLSPSEYRVFPRCALPLEVINSNLAVQFPPLIKEVMQLGACVCGEPAWDRDFNTADLPMMLPLSRLKPHYCQ